MTKVVIIHFAPIELFPPVQNLIHEIENIEGESKIFIFTTAVTIDLPTFKSRSENIKIFRLGRSGRIASIISRYWNYFYFYLKSLFLLVKLNPDRILYFETLSSFPAFIHKRFFKPKVEIFIHYHEYSSPGQYAHGMKLEKYFHNIENWLYPRATWVSHTNKFRMDLFKRDLLPVRFTNEFILPNFPPAKWMIPPKENMGKPLRIVYTGALSLETMFTEKFANWVIAQNGTVLWHIYSYNCTADARDFIMRKKPEWIQLKPGVEYEKLPGILKNYDIGVILYNGHIPNYIYNAPNKMFEYLACGLAVWFPSIMTGSLPYRTKDTYPEVIALDFDGLDDINPFGIMDRSERVLKLTRYYCEEVLAQLTFKLLK